MLLLWGFPVVLHMQFPFLLPCSLIAMQTEGRTVDFFSLTMYPEVEEQVINAGSILNLTCTLRVRLPHNNSARGEWTKQSNITWKKPKIHQNSVIQTSPESEVTEVMRMPYDRLQFFYYKQEKGEVIVSSSMILTDSRSEDTGYFTCWATDPLAQDQFGLLTDGKQQFVYFSSDERLVVIRGKKDKEFTFQSGESGNIPCLPTHPDVVVTLRRTTLHTGETLAEPQKILLSGTNLKWSANSKQGLTLNNVAINDFGKYECVGTKNNKTSGEHFSVKVIGMELTRVGSDEDPLEGTNVTLICRTSTFLAEDDESIESTWIPVSWAYFENKIWNTLNKDSLPEGYSIETKEVFTDDYKYIPTVAIQESRMILFNISLNVYKSFRCIEEGHSQKMKILYEMNKYEEISFRVKEINREPIENIVLLEEGKAANLTCFKSSYNPHIHWSKDGKNYSGKKYSGDNLSILTLEGRADEKGNYTCQWSNSLGEKRFRKFTTTFIAAGDQLLASGTVIIAVSVTLAVLILIIIITVKIYLDKKGKVFPGVDKLLKGNLKELNSHLPIEDQTEWLPYDKRWEFPKHRLRLGTQLGAGCFGRVVKAEAVGIKGESKTVAVKMVRSQANVAALEALVRELKVLIYLGSHLNILNLLGACTVNITKGELFIIVEYCRFGNLQTYLSIHRGHFINQVDDFDNPKGNNEIDERDEITRAKENQSHPDIQYDTLIETPGSHSMATHSSSNEPECPWLLQGEPEAESNQNFSTRDLMSWSFQIARGMGYLASKKVFHGDLAARNVLLADNGVVKVADFGMARKMYYEGNYEQKGQGLMPVKWMAIESLTDRIFSSQSDVWSFGVLLWELFTLGKVPYPGLDSQQMIEKLQSGYRMAKPDYAPYFIGEIMTNCWKKEPHERPTFIELEEQIHVNMESSVSSYYCNLNAPYEKLNGEKQSACVSKTKHFGLAIFLDKRNLLQKSQSMTEGERYSKSPHQIVYKANKRVSHQ